MHGIVGNTRIFRFLDDVLPAGAQCMRLTLQGHGGDALGFSRASMRAWQTQVEEAAAEMRRRCGKLIVVAHSMGCLLTLSEAVRPNVDAYLLLNPPLRLKIRSRLVKNCLKVALGKTERDEVARAAAEAYGITLDKNLLHYYGWPARYIELFKKMAETRKALQASQLQVPTEVFLSAQDEMVSPRSADYFAAQNSCRVALLPASGHYYYAQSDREMICQGMARIYSLFPTPPNFPVRLA